MHIRFDTEYCTTLHQSFLCDVIQQRNFQYERILGMFQFRYIKSCTKTTKNRNIPKISQITYMKSSEAGPCMEWQRSRGLIRLGC
jgi:hypothetical protein